MKLSEFTVEKVRRRFARIKLKPVRGQTVDRTYDGFGPIIGCCVLAAWDNPPPSGRFVSRNYAEGARRLGLTEEQMDAVLSGWDYPTRPSRRGSKEVRAWRKRAAEISKALVK